MKNLNIPIDHLVMLAELDDKEAGQMAKAIALYANKGIDPSFSNSALKAIFTLFSTSFQIPRWSLLFYFPMSSLITSYKLNEIHVTENIEISLDSSETNA